MFKTLQRSMLLALCTLSLGLTACNTMQGAGQDIGRAGEEIEEAAE